MREADIRPEHLLRRYLELSADDAERCFAVPPRCVVPCVACGSERRAPAFTKNGFGYVSCEDCGTLYQSPRPPLAAFESFYRDSISSRFWAEEFFPAVAEPRRASIFRPRAEKLAALCRAKGLKVRRLVEIGAGFGIFLEEWRRLAPESACVAIEPSAHLAAACRAKGFEVYEDIVEHVTDLQGFADLVVCFEVLEHVWQPVEFLRVLARIARPGGSVVITTLGIDGFDIQMLWERSNAVFPPHHINFLSLAGFERAFAAAGLVDIDVTTPGQLDVDIVRNAWKRDPNFADQHRFLRRLIEDEQLASAFQDFLVQNRLSSHVWATGRVAAPRREPA